MILPPNIQSVPSMILNKEKYRVITGDEIINYYQIPTISKEPMGFALNPSNNGMSIVSEQYTFYNMTPEELSAKGKGGNRQMYNYVQANYDKLPIYAPEETYKADKISTDITIDMLQQQRNEEIKINPK